MPFFPHFILRDLFAWTVALACLAGLAAFFPWELGVKADPFAPAPAGIRPEWYFLWVFQSLEYVPARVVGINGELLPSPVKLFDQLQVLILSTPIESLSDCRDNH